MLFQDLLCDERLKQQLIGMVQEKRISHAQLFLSSPGAHAFAVAIAYAQYLSCENPTESDSCGVCPSCLMYEKLTHPDMHLIFPNTTTKTVSKDPDSELLAAPFREFVLENNYHIDIDDWIAFCESGNKQLTINNRDCSNILRHNSTRSYSGGYKVFILWCADRLYHTAAPKLLKTLEEPEPNTLFILITEEYEKILSTILSRTQLVKIPPIHKETIAKQLIIDFSISEQRAQDIANISEGDYRRARSLVQDQVLLNENLNYFLTFFSSVVALAQKRASDQIKYNEVTEMIRELGNQGRERSKSFLKYMLQSFRNILMLNVGNKEGVITTAKELKEFETFQSYITVRNSGKILDECNKAIYHIERNVSYNLVFNDLYFTLSQLVTP
ncbi:MAG TPA: hypothetical protein PLH70_03750 [Bacteroidales bacterium]|nr:hypothetical protein [Bacteroidales bacterium]HOH21975.1 hypothetical protein [Bacteroidales bacterium]HPB57247.1 hypothetical protein [Bacteroidales bacterium]HPZ03494.1 hypothetical protein [Bacteroidales bacterium]HQB74896.1 hypothetical protein [Bacteroidales bacterium]